MTPDGVDDRAREGTRLSEWLAEYVTDCGTTGRGHISTASIPTLAAALADRLADAKAEGGWFADVDQDQTGEYVWQPCLNSNSGHIPCFEVWFKTKAECEDYIRDSILPFAGHFDRTDR